MARGRKSSAKKASSPPKKVTEKEDDNDSDSSEDSVSSGFLTKTHLENTQEETAEAAPVRNAKLTEADSDSEEEEPTPKSRKRKTQSPCSPRFLSANPHQAQVLPTPGNPQGRRSPPPVRHPPRSLSSTQLHASPQLPQLEGKASSQPTPLLAETLSLLEKPPTEAGWVLRKLRRILMPKDPPNPPLLNPGEDTVLVPWL